MGSPHVQPPPTPTPEDSDVLLPPSSPDMSSSSRIPKIRHPPPSPVRIITPVTSNDHPLKSSDLLSPPTNAPQPRQKRRSVAPAPTPLDLPTRADMQAMSAISIAETSGLRGGWIMNTDTSASSAHRRSQASSSMSAGSSRSSAANYRQSLDAEMVDIDLEGGKSDSFGSPRMSSEEHLAQQRADHLAMAPVEHRRMSPITSPLHSRPTSPSPLSIETVAFDFDNTPRATPREESMNMSGVPSPSGFAASSLIRPPPRLGSHSDRGMRATTPDGEGKDKEIVRGSYRLDLEHRERPRGEREASIISVDSQEGLLGDRGESGRSSRNNSPPPFISPASSPSPITQTPRPPPFTEVTSPTVASFPSTNSSEAIRAPVNGTRHKATGSIVAQRRKALEDAMGGLDIKANK